MVRLPLLVAPLALASVLAGPSGAQAAQEKAEPAPARGLRLHDEGASFAGYTLFSPLISNTTFLIDMQGEVVHRWDVGVPPGNIAYLLDDGSLLRCVREQDPPVFSGGGIGGRIQRFSWGGEKLWDYDFSDEYRCQHHDVEPLANGNLLLIAWDRFDEETALAMGRDEEVVGAAGWWPDAVYEIRPVLPDGGEIVWEWHVADHLIQDRDPDLSGYGDVPSEPGRVDVNATHRDRPPMTEAEREAEAERLAQMRALGYLGEEEEAEEAAAPRRGNAADWLHVNSIDHHPELDLILLSSPRMNEIWVIDHATTTEEAASDVGGRRGRGGELLWRWGNPRTYGAGTDADQRLFAQHDARWIPAGSPGAGHVMVFNNGLRRSAEPYSSVDELVLPMDAEGRFTRAPGQAYGPAAPLWSYRSEDPEAFYSFFISGAERLPNGNTLICSGAQGRFFEVTPEGRIVWEYWNPYGGEEGAPGNNMGIDPKAVFRVERLAPDHPGLAGRL